MKKLVLLFGFIIVLSLSLFVGCQNDNNSNNETYEYHKENLTTLSAVVDSATAEKMLTALETSCAIEKETKLVKEDIIKYSNSTYELYAGLMVRFDIQDTQVKLYTFETTYSNNPILLYDSSRTNTTKVLSKEERNSLIYTQRRYTVHNTIRISPRSGSLLHNALGSVKIDDLTFTNRSDTALTYVSVIITPYLAGTSYSYNNGSYMLDEQLSVGASETCDLTKSGWSNYDSYKITQCTIAFADGTTIGFNEFDCQFLDGNGDSPDTILRDSQITYHLYNEQIEVQKFYSGFGNGLNTPYRYGYNFLGWYDNDECIGTPIEKIAIGEQVNIDLYAKWDVINVNIIYNGNGNTGGETENQVAQIGSSIIIRENNYTKEGFYFVGWTESVGGHEIIAPNTIYDLSLSEKDITLYAKWAKDIYSIEDFNSIKEDDDCIFVLKNDIDFNGTSAKTVTLFKGIFEGNYFSIKNSSSPLFLENNGIINNVVVENCELSKFDNYLYNGSSVNEGDIDFNYAYGGIVAINRGTIKNSLINLSIIKDFPTGTTSCFGGIVAINEGGSIICCKSNISATHNNIGESLCWGGIVGISSNSINKGVIGNCYSTGTLDLPQKGDENPSKELVIGGILGFGKNITIKNSISIIDMNIAMNYTTFKDIGGILGQSGYGNVVIDSCVTIGNINCLDVGIVYVGGIACDSDFAYTVKNCYSNNSITLMYDTSYYVENGIRVSRDSFLQADFYSNNDILEFFIDLDTLKYNENAVWIIADGELPKLYWETN